MESARFSPAKARVPWSALDKIRLRGPLKIIDTVHFDHARPISHKTRPLKPSNVVVKTLRLPFHPMRLRLPHLLLASAALIGSLRGETLIRFEKKVLETKFYAEGASFGDINGDGKNDIVYGPYWFEGPDYTKRHTIYTPKEYNINGYSDNFFSYVFDANGDGHPDVLVIGFPGKEARLYINPGKGVENVTEWKSYIVADVVDNESPEFTDITGDGKPEIVCSKGGQFGYYEPDWKDVTKPWTWHPVTDNVGVSKFTHGLGIGDVNGDGKPDLLEARRWWEHTDTGTWKPHTFDLTGGGGAQMFAYDFTGSGRKDIVTSLNAHGYGLAWFEHKAGANGPTWEKHLIAGQEPWENPYGIRFSQPHAMALADVDGDGLKDIIVGKRYWAHNGHDPDERDPKVLYWFQTVRGKNGKVDFVPHMIDDDTGVGTQLTVGDVDGDGLLDVVIGNKYGCHVLLQRRETVSAERYAQFQPKKFYGPDHIQPKDYVAGQKPQDAAAHMTLPAGFKAELIAAEPDLVQPIAMCFDERGRLWVAEGNSYPQKRPEGQGQDRILIFEDTKGTGKYDKRTVFIEGLNLVSGLEVGFGGVWVGAAPQFLFIPKDENDKAGKPQVLLDGWGLQDTHETLNSFTWGPDGWLYGCHGVFTYSLVGKPGAPDSERTPINAGVWRYHPVDHVFEVFAQGTSNPWGLDYNDKGEFFITACVIPHLYHILPGARYQRQGGQHYNPYTYDDIKTIANHAHFAGRVSDNAHWGAHHSSVNLPVTDDTDEAGGGHAHCGLCIYQADNFPAEYQNELIFGNLHGHRLVHDHVEAHQKEFESGYVGEHRSDFMHSNDHWFIPIQQKIGPDGALYVSDWSDKQVCHQGSNAIDMWDRSNGRIFRVTYDTLKPRKIDLTKLSELELAKLAVEDPNVYVTRQARKVLMERSAAIKDGTERAKLISGPAGSYLNRIIAPEPGVLVQDANRTLRAMWALYDLGLSMGPVEDGFDFAKDEHVRAWAVRLAGEQKMKTPTEHFIKLAQVEKSPIVRRELASLLQRLPLPDRFEIAKALIAQKEDADDHNIPLLLWYGIEPLVAADAKAGVALANASKMDQITAYIYRRMSTDDNGRNALLSATAALPDPGQRERTLSMLVESARNTGKHSMPAEWPTVAAKLSQGGGPKTKALVDEMSALFGDAAAMQKFRDELAIPNSPEREHALAVLLQVHDLATAKILQNIISQEKQATPLRRKAIQSLVSLPDPGNAAVLLAAYSGLTNDEKTDAVGSLASTQEGAKALLEAVGAGKIERQMLSPFLIRQLQTLNNKEVDSLISKVWGTMNQAKADMPQQKAKWRAILTPAKLKVASVEKGHTLFKATCATCHRLYGEGANVGPDITGSNRGNLDYLLDNVLDPSAVIGKGYELNVFTMKDARVISGIMKEETSTGFRIAMPGGVEFVLNKPEVAKRDILKISMMPEGQFDALGADNVVDLVAFLQHNASSSSGGTSAAPHVKVAGAIEGEEMKVLQQKGNVRPQAMGHYQASRWSGDSQLWWTGAKVGDTLTLALPVEKAGKYDLKAVLTKARDYGIVDVSLDDKEVSGGPIDLFNSPDVTTSGELDWGVHELTAGEHKLTFKVVGSNPQAAPGHMVGLDYVKLEAK